jgi:cobalt-zinc-cadmium efflux system membrane fusion protein
MKKIKLYTAVLLITVISACREKKVEEVVQPFSLTDTMMSMTSFVKAEIRPVSSELKLFGKVSAANSKQANVFPVVGGTVEKVNAELGDFVHQGQVLAVIRSGEVAEYERQRMEASSDVAIAEKNLQVARDMFNGKLTSEKDVVTAEKEYQKAMASQQRINEVFRIYSMGKGSTYNVTAPISGFIIDKNITQNTQISTDHTSNIFSIAQIDEVWVLANVNESDISKISQGMDADIRTISYPDRLFRGKVDKLFNVLDDETRTMKVRINISNTDLALKPEMSATVSLHMREGKELIAIPSSAIIFDKSKNWVMVYKNRGDIETRPVEVYRQSGDTTYIASGLKSGETVISKNQLLIYDALND